MPCWRCRARPSFPQNKRALAYLDLDLDVSEGGAAKRFLIKPVVLAKMLQAAEIKETDRVLVVGCATGYAAAVIAKLAGQVTATESDSALAAKAQACLAAIGCGNVTVRTAAAAEGDPADAPYDVIVLNGATEIVPERLYGQFGGRPAGRRFRDIAAAAGDDRDPFPWRFRAPGAVRCRRPGAARPGTAFPPSFSSVSAVSTPNIRPSSPAKSRSKSEVWPDCPT